MPYEIEQNSGEVSDIKHWIEAGTKGSQCSQFPNVLRAAWDNT